MYSASDIKSAARKVHDAAVDLKSQERRMDGTVSQTATWWKGQAGQAFTSEYHRETKQAMNRLYTEMNNMKSSLERLAREVRRADEQRRIEAQRRAMADR